MRERAPSPITQKLFQKFYSPHFYFNQSEMISMPKKTPEGYEMLMYRLTDTDPSKIMFADSIKGFCMFNDLRLSEDLLADGYVVVFDMKGVRLSHITRVQLGPLRSFMAYIQEAHPARLKKIYICHAASFVNQVMSLVKPLIKSELMSLLHFTTKGPQTLFAKELLPIVSTECGDIFWQRLIPFFFLVVVSCAGIRRRMWFNAHILQGTAKKSRTKLS